MNNIKDAWNTFHKNLTEEKINNNDITPQKTKIHYDNIDKQQIKNMIAYQHAKDYWVNNNV
jgi:hypothetical protein